MKQPWQIWLIFGLCLAVVLPAMSWLSYKTIQLDALRENDRLETEVARRQAELQERISSALYRMDLKMLPLISQEAARPHFFYKPFYSVSNPVASILDQVADSLPLQQSENSLLNEIPSPLLAELPEFVILHFQIDINNSISSPQRPVGDQEAMAFSCCGLTPEIVASNEEKVDQASLF